MCGTRGRSSGALQDRARSACRSTQNNTHSVLFRQTTRMQLAGRPSCCSRAARGGRQAACVRAAPAAAHRSVGAPSSRPSWRIGAQPEEAVAQFDVDAPVPEREQDLGPRDDDVGRSGRGPCAPSALHLHLACPAKQMHIGHLWALADLGCCITWRRCSPTAWRIASTRRPRPQRRPSSAATTDARCAQLLSQQASILHDAASGLERSRVGSFGAFDVRGPISPPLRRSSSTYRSSGTPSQGPSSPTVAIRQLATAVCLVAGRAVSPGPVQPGQEGRCQDPQPDLHPARRSASGA
jgi:hypothetical protein